MKGVRASLGGLALACVCVAAHAATVADQAAPANANGVVIVARQGETDFCSGTVLSDTMVLTALHCVQDIGTDAPRPAAAFRVGFGAATFDKNVRWIGVGEVRTRGVTRLGKVEDLQGIDVAVLMLQTPFAGERFSLPEQTPPPQVGSKLTIVGFGEDRYGLVGRRHATTVTVTGHTPDGFTFVGGACRGDSGGPILDGKGRLIGVVSIGTSRHCTPNFTRIGQPLAPFADFIVDQLLRDGQNN